MKRMWNMFPNISFSNQTISNSFRKEPFVFVDSCLCIEQDNAMKRDRYNYRSISSYKHRCVNTNKRSLNSGVNTKDEMGMFNNKRKSNVKYLSLFCEGNDIAGAKCVYKCSNNNSRNSNSNSGYVIKTKYLRYLNEELNKKYTPNYKSYNKLYEAMKQHRRRKYDPTNV